MNKTQFNILWWTKCLWIVVKKSSTGDDSYAGMRIQAQASFDADFCVVIIVTGRLLLQLVSVVNIISSMLDDAPVRRRSADGRSNRFCTARLIFRITENEPAPLPRDTTAPAQHVTSLNFH